jgi:hypothetical protein
MSLVNPVEFYGLGDEKVLASINGALGSGKNINKKKMVNTLLENNFKRISALKDQSAKIKLALANV